MRTVEDIQAEMDAAEEAHEQRMNALQDELYAAEEAADPGCHDRELAARVERMAVSIQHFERMKKVMSSINTDEDDPSKEASE